MTSKIKPIFIRLDAGHKKGMGHLYRMMALARAFNNFKTAAFNVQVVFLIRKDEVAERLIEEKGCRCIAFAHNLDEEDLISRALTQPGDDKPGLWIFDLLDTQKTWYEELKSNKIPVVSFDDTGAGKSCASKVFNPIAGCWAEEETAHNNIFNGPAYMVVSDQVREYRKKRRIPDQKKLKIGITLGGSDTYGNTLKAVEALACITGIRNKIEEIYLFLGPHFQFEARLQQVLADVEFNVRIKKSVNNLYRYLDRMDAVICGGGVTLFEVCTMGLPALTIANEPHETKTIYYFLRRNAVLLLGDSSSPVVEMKDRLSAGLNNTGLLNEIALNGHGLVDGKGLERVAARIKPDFPGD